MSESPVDVLQRWEDHGALWRAALVTDTHAIVALCACTGEQVDTLRSDDPALLAYLAGRPSSEDPGPDDPPRGGRPAG